MKKTLAWILALCLLLAGLPAALSEAPDEELLVFEGEDDYAAAEVGDGDLSELPIDEDADLEGCVTPPQDGDESAALYARLLRDTPIFADPDGSDALATLPEGSAVLVIDAAQTLTKVALATGRGVIVGYIPANCAAPLTGDETSTMQAELFAGSVMLYEDDLDRPLPWAEPLAETAEILPTDEDADSEPVETPDVQGAVDSQPAETPDVRGAVDSEPAETPDIQDAVDSEPAETPDLQDTVDSQPAETPDLQDTVDSKPAETPNVQDASETGSDDASGDGDAVPADGEAAVDAPDTQAGQADDPQNPAIEFEENAVDNADVDAPYDEADALSDPMEPAESQASPVRQPAEKTIEADDSEDESFDIESTLDSDDLFAAYVNRFFYPSSRRKLKTMASANAGSQLTGQDRSIYEALKPEIAKAAAGERSSTCFNVPMASLLSQTSFTATELGVTVELSDDGNLSDPSLTAMQTAYKDNLSYNWNLISHALWLDCTYELYWLDRYTNPKLKPVKFAYDFLYSYNAALDDFVISSSRLTIKLPVLDEYMAGDSDDYYTIDTSLIQSAQTAAENARAIVGKYAGYSDVAKLFGYAREICQLVKYNDDAVKSDWPDAQQDPWKLIWVFDGDSSTNVVCEGYAQAFQYLCELTDFEGGVGVYMVTGYINGDENEGHSWNLVRLNGASYAVDVTWMDDYGLGTLSGHMADWLSDEKGALFLCGAGSGSVSEGYTIDYRDGDRASFRTYRPADTLALYPESVLTLAKSKYVLTGWQTMEGKTYYFNSEGRYVTGVRLIQNTAYAFSDSGDLRGVATGWQSIGGSAYYFDGEGRFVTGVQEIDGQYYRFDEAGKLISSQVTGWQTFNGSRYFFESDGTLHTVHTEEIIAAAASTDTEDGLTEGKRCSVCGVVLVEQEPVHRWSDPEYSWASDNSSVTAKRVCLNDASHVEIETVKTTSRVAVPAACTTKGETAYTAAFANSAFATQIRTTADIPATGHRWGSASYTWASDNSSVTARRVCLNDASHAQTETVKTTSRVAVPATCTAKGKTAYTAAFANSAFATQTRTAADIPATGHTPVVDKAVAPSCVESGLTEGSHCAVCGQALVPQQTVPATGHTSVVDKAVSPTYTKAGKTEGSHCAVCGQTLVKQKTVKKLALPKNGLLLTKNTSKSVKKGGKIQIVLNSGKIKSCVSSDKKVATVGKTTGLVTAKKAGTAKITVTLASKKKLVLKVKVTDPYAPKSIKITKGKTATVKKGKKLALKTKLTPANAKTTLKWTSSNKKVATVSSKGVVKGLKKGKAKITVSTSNGKKATITITVK